MNTKDKCDDFRGRSNQKLRRPFVLMEMTSRSQEIMKGGNELESSNEFESCGYMRPETKSMGIMVQLQQEVGPVILVI